MFISCWIRLNVAVIIACEAMIFTKVVINVETRSSPVADKLLTVAKIAKTYMILKLSISISTRVGCRLSLPEKRSIMASGNCSIEQIAYNSFSVNNETRSLAEVRQDQRWIDEARER